MIRGLGRAAFLLAGTLGLPGLASPALADPAGDGVVRIDGHPIRTVLPRDLIPAIDHPELVAADRAGFLEPGELVLGVVLDGEARAYPIDELNRHEIVNDFLAGRSIAATW